MNANARTLAGYRAGADNWIGNLTSIPHSNGDTRSTIERAVHQARLGYHVFPCYPIEDGHCTCHDTGGRNCTPGKHPIGKLVPHGSDDATADPAIISQWWAMWPDANIGIALEPSGLLVIAPDCLDRLTDFEQRGLPETMTVESGSGAGHRHYYYRRPDGCPMHRMCRSGDYDILSAGYVVGPGSFTTDEYRLLTPASSVDELPDAPAWAVAMLMNAAARTCQPTQSEHDTGDEPPVGLTGDALDRWHGKRNRPNDRSGTLWDIARDLARAGMSERWIALAIQDRDQALGLDKYAGRPDAWTRYVGTARRAIAAAESDGAPIVPNGNHVPAPKASAADELAAARELQRRTMAVLHNPKLTAGEKITAIATLFTVQSKRSRGVGDDGWTPLYRAEIAEASGCSPSTVTTRVGRLAEWGVLDRRVRRVERADRETGEVTTVSQLEVRLPEDTTETLDRLATLDPERPNSWGGKRQTICPDCGPDADIIVRRIVVCGGCGQILDERDRTLKAQDDISEESRSPPCALGTVIPMARKPRVHVSEPCAALAPVRGWDDP